MTEWPTTGWRSPRGHLQVVVWCPWRGYAIEVDEGIAPMLRWLWDHDVRTRYSCEGSQREPAWIDLGCAENVERFVAVMPLRPGRRSWQIKGSRVSFSPALREPSVFRRSASH
jgi:hypothetical protein